MTAAEQAVIDAAVAFGAFFDTPSNVTMTWSEWQTARDLVTDRLRDAVRRLIAERGTS